MLTTLEMARAEFGFYAAHIALYNGEVEPLHGHTFQVTLRVSGEPDTSGMVAECVTGASVSRRPPATCRQPPASAVAAPAAASRTHQLARLGGDPPAVEQHHLQLVQVSDPLLGRVVAEILRRGIEVVQVDTFAEQLRRAGEDVHPGYHPGRDPHTVGDSACLPAHPRHRDVEGGMRELTLQKRLGHASPESTRIYTRVSDPAVVADYNRALGGQGTTAGGQP